MAAVRCAARRLGGALLQPTQAAVRCAARRLGGALLQPTQAAVAEEGRLLAPSRLMRSRHLSSEVSGGELQRSQVAEQHLLEPGWLMRSRQLARQISKKRQPSALDSEVQWMLEEFSASRDRLEELQKETAPDAFKLGVMAYGRAAKAVVGGAARAMFCFCMITSLIFSDKEVEAQAVTSEDEME